MYVGNIKANDHIKIWLKYDNKYVILQGSR